MFVTGLASLARVVSQGVTLLRHRPGNDRLARYLPNPKERVEPKGYAFGGKRVFLRSVKPSLGDPHVLRFGVYGLIPFDIPWLLLVADGVPAVQRARI